MGALTACNCTRGGKCTVPPDDWGHRSNVLSQCAESEAWQEYLELNQLTDEYKVTEEAA